MRTANSETSVVSKILRNIVLVLFLIIFASIIYNLKNRESPTESALMAEASASVEFRGVFIREEQPVNFSGIGSLSYSVPDGGKLGSGSVIAQVYENDSQIIVNREIEQLENQLAILNKIQNPGTLESAQPASLSKNIESAYRNLIYICDTKDYSDVNSEAEELLVLLSTYQMVTDEITDFNTEINGISSRLAELKASNAAPVETITSDRPAYFVSYCDGYENTLTEESLDSITVEQLKGITDSKQNDPTVVGKLIDGYQWYLAGIIDNSNKLYQIGENVQLRFESASETFDAEIIDVRDEGDPAESIIIVSCNQFNYDLVQHRCKQVELIKGDYSGLKVPREAIRFKPFEQTEIDTELGMETTVTKNYKGVYVLKGEQVEFKKIDVIYEGSDYVLSAVRNDDSSYLALYDDIMVEGADSFE
ncbi:MAG: HlyD family efflux transporter periplasmic adaptor subunit [Ruminococcus sp.]